MPKSADTHERTEPRPDPRRRLEKQITKTEFLEKLAPVVLLVLAALGLVLVTGSNDGLGMIAVFTYGIACLIGAGIMVVPAFALPGHRVGAETHLHLAEQVAELAEQVAALDEAAAKRAADFATLRSEQADLRAAIAALRDALIAAGREQASAKAVNEIANHRYRDTR